MVEGWLPWSRGRGGRVKDAPRSQVSEGPTIEQSSVIKEIRLGVELEHMGTFLHWMEHESVRGHLDPLPRFPNWKDPKDVEEAKVELYDYYRNANRESKTFDHEGVQPMTAYNELGEPIGVLTIRWRGDKYVPKEKRIASIERLVVRPDLFKRGIGTAMMEKATNYSFNDYTGYKDGQGAEEMRAWVFVDGIATGFEKNIRLMHKVGYERLSNERGAWSKYAKLLGIETDREAYWYKVDKDTWNESNKNKNGVTAEKPPTYQVAI